MKYFAFLEEESLEAGNDLWLEWMFNLQLDKNTKDTEPELPQDDSRSKHMYVWETSIFSILTEHLLFYSEGWAKTMYTNMQMW